MKILILTLLLIGTAFGQLDYGPKATNKEAAVKMHFAIRLFRGNLDQAQEEFLVKAIIDRRTINEADAARLFTRAELRDIFFGIGREDISTFRQIYDKGRIAEKREAWRNLLFSDQIDVRRINFAWGVGYLNLNEVQIGYLLRFSKSLPVVTKDELDVFQAEALEIFSREHGILMFGSIGPYVDTCKERDANLQPSNCQCSIGSSFNMSCDGDCGSSSCRATGDGCGFAWLYSCNGWCVAT